MKIYKIYKNTSRLNKEIYLTKNYLSKNKNNSTFNLKKILKDRELKFKPTLLNLVYYSGFVKSLKEAKHIILNNYIKLNNSFVNEPNIKIKSGDIIISTYKNTLLSYYERRWNIIKFNSRNKKSNNLIKLNKSLLTIDKKNYILNKNIIRTYKKFKYMISKKRIHRLSYNSIIWI